MIEDIKGTEMYPYTYVYKGKKQIVIWQTNKEGQDSFKLDSKNCLIISQTEDELRKLLGDDSEKIRWSEGGEINFDKFRTALKNLRTGRASSKETCRVIIDGWNFLEDLARTFGLADEIEKLHSTLLNRIYHKMFYGINLPSVTPEGKSYSPLWEHEEIFLLRNAFRFIWKLFIRICQR